MVRKCFRFFERRNRGLIIRATPMRRPAFWPYSSEELRKGDIQRPLVTLKLQADALINPQGAFGVLGYRSNCFGNVFAIVFAFGRRREDALGG